jgi:glutathione synthase
MSAMALRVAVQMDPIEHINVGGDSSFALMLEAQARGHSLFHYLAPALSAEAGHVRTTARALSVSRQPSVSRERGAHFKWLAPAQTLDLADDVDVVLMRQDPPFDMGYITATHLLEMVADKTLIVNDPTEVRNAPEKLFVLRYPDLMPPTLVTRSLDEAMDFRARHGAVVVKPLYGNAGAAVFLIDEKDGNLPALTELFGSIWREPFMVQAFLPSVAAGDKRIVLVDGEPTGAINRLPKSGEIRSNLAAGGSAEACELTAREAEICARIGPDLKSRGLIFVGIDVIGGYLTEINVTSPTGIVAIDKFNGTNTPALIWDAIEARLRR